MSQIEVTVAAMGHEVLEYGVAGVLPERGGNRHPRIAPHGCYPCSGDDEWVSIAAGSDGEWRALAGVIGEPWAAEARFDDLEGRKRDEDELDRLIGEWTRSRTKHEVTEILQGVGVAALPTLNTLDLPADPHLQACGVYPAGGHPHLPGGGVRARSVESEEDAAVGGGACAVRGGAQPGGLRRLAWEVGSGVPSADRRRGRRRGRRPFLGHAVPGVEGVAAPGSTGT